MGVLAEGWSWKGAEWSCNDRKWSQNDGNGLVRGVPVVNDGPEKYCCQWCFTSGLTLASLTALG